MNQLPVNTWSNPQRQAKAGLLVILFKSAVTIIKTLWPLLVVLLFKRKSKGIDSFEIVLIVLPLLILLQSLVEYFYFRFFISNNELIIRKGFIRKKTITIPLSKIQAVHIEQNLLHQLVKVAKVKIDTAGSEKTEAVIDAIEVYKAEQLKEFLLQQKQEITHEGIVLPSPPEAPFIRLSFTDLLKLGVSSNHIQTFFIVLTFAFSILLELQDMFGKKVMDTLIHSSAGITLSYSSVSLAIAFVLSISVLVSLIRIMLIYFDFHLSETPQGFKLKTGLFNVRQNLVPFSKIQYISWSANWIRHKLGLYHLEFSLVKEEETTNKRRVQIPVTNVESIGKLLSHYHDPVKLSAHSVHSIHKVYPFRRTLLRAILPVTALLIILQFFVLNMWVYVIVLWIPYVYINAFFFRKRFRLYVAPDAFQINSGIWGREVKIVKWYKIQQVVLQQSIYQRHKDLATVHLDTAGGEITIPYIPLELARLICNYALYEIERSPRPWI